MGAMSESDRGSEQEGFARNQIAEDFDGCFQRLKEAVGAGTETELGRSLGIKQESIAVARKRKQLPPRWFVDIYFRFGISVDWILSGTGPMKRGEAPAGHGEIATEERCLSPEDFVTLPLLESWVRGGPEGEIIYEGIADHYPFKRWWIEQLVGASAERQQKLLLVKVRGDSMSPTINHGELVMVDTHEAERINIRTGDIYLVIMPDGGAVIKRLATGKDDDGKYRLICMSDNVSSYRPFDFLLDRGKKIQDYVLGRVRWCGKEFA